MDTPVKPLWTVGKTSAYDARKDCQRQRRKVSVGFMRLLLELPHAHFLSHNERELDGNRHSKSDRVSVFTNYIRWSTNVDLGATFSLDTFSQELNFADLNEDVPAGRVSLSIVGFNNRFTPEFEATGRIIFEASDGEMLEVTIANADMTETYAWTPTNSAEVVAFVAHVKSLSDNNATLTLTDETAGPSILALSAVADQAGTVGIAVDLLLPEATGGNPPYIYTATNLPVGLSFSTLTRRITGTPTTVETTTVSYAVTDSHGDGQSVDFTFTISAATPPPAATAAAAATIATG